MSRSGYSVERAIKGKRGQAFLRELASAMDAMPEKVLITEELISADGGCCAIGTVCKARGLDVSKVDYEDPDSVARVIDVARCMAAEIAYENDEGDWEGKETDSERWQRIRKWVNDNLTKAEL